MRIHVHEFSTFLPQVVTPLIPHSSVTYFTLNVNILWLFINQDSAYFHLSYVVCRKNKVNYDW